MEKSDFSRRLTQLRMQKGISARDMSLSLGQSAAYINNIENGVSLPSMASFFYICDFLGVSPAEFFETDNANPSKLTSLLNAAKYLDEDQLEHLTALAKGLRHT